MSHKSRLKNPKYRNWVRAALGLIHLGEGLESFTDDVLKKQHQNILIQASGNTSIQCNQCNLKTLQPNHVKGKNRYCPLGHFKCNCNQPKHIVACPKNICGNIYDAIIRSHGSTPPDPYWNNTNINNWCANHWEIGKCYINAPGYGKKTKASEIDCSGLLHILINNKEFHKHIQGSITGSDVFSKARQLRNQIFHSQSMELEDTDTDGYIDIMIAVLEDPKELLMRTECVTSVRNLKELKQNKLVITLDAEERVLRDAEIIIESYRTNNIPQRLDNLEDNVNRQESDINDLKERKTVAHDDLNQSLADLKSRVSQLESTEGEQITSIKKTLADHTKDIEKLDKVKAAQAEQLNYIKRKQELKRRLIHIYKSKVIKIPATPLSQRPDTPINDVYVFPWMVNSESTLSCRRNGYLDRAPIATADEIFYTDGKLAKLIYIHGEAGSGKSAFCKYMVNEWCLAHSAEDSEETITLKEEMKRFEFLFFVHLCHHKGVEDDSILEMLKNLYEPTVVDIIENESIACLIVMDGLDEWKPIGECSTSRFQPQGVPKRDLTKDYTIITTSRPWKTNALNLDESEMDKSVELLGIHNDTMESFVAKVMPFIDETCSGSEDIVSNLQKPSLSDLATVPFFLLQLICIWINSNQNFEMTRCEMYSRMLNCLFVWTTQRKPNDKDLKAVKEKRDHYRNLRFDAIKSLQNKTLVQEYKFLICEAAKVAFHTLILKKQHSITFSQKDLRSLEIDTQIENACLKLGIFRQEQYEKIRSGTFEQFPTYSFVHKTVSEYLAALYITLQCQSANTEDRQKGIDEHLKTCLTIDDVLEQENVLTILCNLDPSLTPHISDFIYKIVNRDKQFQSYRNQMEKGNYKLYRVQDIIFKCMEESSSQEDEQVSKDSICLADIVIENDTNVKFIDNLDPYKIVSLNVQECDRFTEDFYDCKLIGEHELYEENSDDFGETGENDKEDFTDEKIENCFVDSDNDDDDDDDDDDDGVDDDDDDDDNDDDDDANDDNEVDEENEEANDGDNFDNDVDDDYYSSTSNVSDDNEGICFDNERNDDSTLDSGYKDILNEQSASSDNGSAHTEVLENMQSLNSDTIDGDENLADSASVDNENENCFFSSLQKKFHKCQIKKTVYE